MPDSGAFEDRIPWTPHNGALAIPFITNFQQSAPEQIGNPWALLMFMPGHGSAGINRDQSRSQNPALQCSELLAQVERAEVQCGDVPCLTRCHPMGGLLLCFGNDSGVLGTRTC